MSSNNTPDTRLVIAGDVKVGDRIMRRGRLRRVESIREGAKGRTLFVRLSNGSDERVMVLRAEAVEVAR